MFFLSAEEISSNEREADSQASSSVKASPDSCFDFPCFIYQSQILQPSSSRCKSPTKKIQDQARAIMINLVQGLEEVKKPKILKEQFLAFRREHRAWTEAEKSYLKAWRTSYRDQSSTEAVDTDGIVDCDVDYWCKKGDLDEAFVSATAPVTGGHEQMWNAIVKRRRMT